MNQMGHSSRFPMNGALVLWGLWALFFVGCGGPSGDMGAVSGTVTLDGEPLPNAVVEYSPLEPELKPAYGKTDESGYYTLMSSRSQEGAKIGEYEVRIRTGDVDSVDGVQVNIPEVVPTNYNDETELKQTVEPGSNTHDFALQSGGEVVQPDLE